MGTGRFMSTNNAASTQRWRAWPMSSRCPSTRASTSPSRRNSTVTAYSLPQAGTSYGRIRWFAGSYSGRNDTEIGYNRPPTLT